MKTLVLTAITGGKDVLIDPPKRFDNCDYIAFVDKEYPNIKVWEQRSVIPFSSIDNFFDRRNAKPYKILSSIMFPEYDYIIWEDGNHQLKMDPKKIIEEYGDDADLLLFKHPDRKCVYSEIQACAGWGLDDPQTLQRQHQFYKTVGMPDNWGLFEMSTFIRKNTFAVKQFDLMWWEQICKFSSRDQISLPFVLWRLTGGINVKTLSGYANLHTMQGKMSGNIYFNDQGRHAK